jgi:hypothetical protein
MSDFNWRDHLPVHPAADLFPLMSESELKELAEDIKKNGLQHPVVIRSDPDYDWRDHRYQLIDGRNRLDALALLGRLAPHSKTAVSNAQASGPFTVRDRHSALKIDMLGAGNWFDYPKISDDAAAYRYVIAANVHRRHLNAEQKRDLITKLLKATPEQSNRTIAKQVKADDKTVGTVRRELEGRAEIPHVETRTDTKGRKQPSSKPERKPTERLPAKVKVNGQPIKTDDFSPAAQEQIARALESQPEVSSPEAAPVTPAVSYLEKPWLAHATEESVAEEKRIVIRHEEEPAAETTTRLVVVSEAAVRQPQTFDPDASLFELEKRLQLTVEELDVAEREAAELIRCMVDHRKQGIRSIAKLIGKDPKWVKEKFDAAKPVTEAAA